MDPLDAKMSKSKPDSAIFITDSEEDIRRKLKAAFCPARQVENNPVLDICRHVIFPSMGVLKISRPAKYGGDLEIKSIEELSGLHAGDGLHPADLKTGVAAALVEILAPVRGYFVEHPQNLKKVQSLIASR